MPQNINSMLRNSIKKWLVMSLILYVVASQNYTFPCQGYGVIPLNVSGAYFINGGSYANANLSYSGNTIIAAINNLTTSASIYIPLVTQMNTLTQTVITFTNPSMPIGVVNIGLPSVGNFIVSPINSFQYILAGNNITSTSVLFLSNNDYYCRNNPIYVTIQIFTGFFNVLSDDKCSEYCLQSAFSFASANGVTVPTQVVCGVYYPCQNYFIPVNIIFASTNNNNVYLTFSNNVISGNWINPVAGQSMILSFFGWQSGDGIPIIAQVSPPTGTTSNFYASIALNQQDVIYMDLYNNSTYVFAQMDNSNQNFFIQIQALSNLNTLSFQVNLYQGGYNNYQNNTCQTYCYGSIAFATQGNPYEYVCLQNYQSVTSFVTE